MSKRQVDENKIDFYQVALYYRSCEYCLFKRAIWTRFNFNKSMVAVNGMIWT